VIQPKSSQTRNESFARRIAQAFQVRTSSKAVAGVASGEVVVCWVQRRRQDHLLYMIVGCAADAGASTWTSAKLTQLPIIAASSASRTAAENSVFRSCLRRECAAVLDCRACRPRVSRLADCWRAEHIACASTRAFLSGERRRWKSPVHVAPAASSARRAFAGRSIAVLDIQRIIGYLKERGIGC